MKLFSQEQPVSGGRQLVILAVVFIVCTAFKAMPYLMKQVDPVDATSYLWNFSPLMPLAVVLGATFSLQVAVLAAAGVWFAGDLAIWAASGRWDWAFYAGQPVVYFCLGLVVAVGFVGSRFHRSQHLLGKMGTNLLSGLVAAAVFFVVSNFLVWLLASEVTYAKTLGGLLECYTMAIPFHKNDFISMLIYVPALTWLIASPVEESQAALAMLKTH